MKTVTTTITLFCFCLFTVYGSGLLVYRVVMDDCSMICLMETEQHPECWMMQAPPCHENEEVASSSSAECNSHCGNFCPSTEPVKELKKVSRSGVDHLACGDCLQFPENAGIVLQELIVQPVRDEDMDVQIVENVQRERLFSAETHQPLPNNSIHPSISFSRLLL